MVLNRRRATLAGWIIAGTTLLLIFAGCGILFFRSGDREFNHARHTAKGITCDACHYDYDTQPVVGMPSYKTCFACHGQGAKRDLYPFEEAMQSHSPEMTFQARERFYDFRFSHAIHIQKKVPCEECHREPDEAHRQFGRADECAECHRTQGVKFECALCHQEMRKDTPPPSHQGEAWRRTHGHSVALGCERGHSQSCQLCHSQGFCDDCHSVEKPANHTEFFRIAGHGFQAGIRRESCMACHQENFCVRCHQETPPRSHSSPSWGGGTSNHCLSCHEPVGVSRCSVCHRGAPSHLTATPIPGPPHPRPQSNCYQCHLRPPHADNRMPCTVCHK